MLWQLNCRCGGCSLLVRERSVAAEPCCSHITGSSVVAPPLLQIIDVLHPGRPNVPKVRHVVHKLLVEQKSAVSNCEQHYAVCIALMFVDITG